MTNTEDYEKEKSRYFSGSPNEKALIRQMNEKNSIIEALTNLAARQHGELLTAQARINDLLQSNNKFEQRARNAERQLKAPEELAKLTEAGQELYVALTGAFEFEAGSDIADAVHEYIEASNAYFDRLSKASR